jgi:hypothetical protein
VERVILWGSEERERHPDVLATPYSRESTMKGLLDTIGMVIHLVIEGVNQPDDPCIEYLRDEFVYVGLPARCEPLAPEDVVYADHRVWWMNGNSNDALMRLGVFGSVGARNMLFAIDRAGLHLGDPYTVPSDTGGTVFVFRIHTTLGEMIPNGTLSFEVDSKVAARLSEDLATRASRKISARSLRYRLHQYLVDGVEEGVGVR